MSSLKVVGLFKNRGKQISLKLSITIIIHHMKKKYLIGMN
jgi:hypothetical protein